MFRLIVLTLLLAIASSTIAYNSINVDSSLTVSQGFHMESDIAGDYFGWHVCSLGDFNHDGVDDIALSAYQASPLERSTAGAIYVVYGKKGGGLPGFSSDADFSSSQGFRIFGSEPGDTIGYSVESAGDFNHDGIPDLIVGASASSPLKRTSAGTAYVIYGKKGGYSADIDLNSALSPSYGFRIFGALERDTLGQAVNTAGDFNGDGIDDIVVGAPAQGFSSDPRIYIIYGKKGGLSADIDLSSPLSMSQGVVITDSIQGLGFKVSPAGDFNHDGIADVLISTPYDNYLHRSNGGTVYVVYGRKGGFSENIDLSATSSMSQRFRMIGFDSSYLGFGISSAGDINADGIDDIVVGAPLALYSEVACGVATILYGKKGGVLSDIDLNDGITTSQGFQVYGPNTGYIGYSTSPTGDINDDGIDDIILGAPTDSIVGAYAGSAFVVYGKKGTTRTTLDFSSTVDSTEGFKLSGVSAPGYFGVSVSAADVNADGVKDLIIGAPISTSSSENANAGMTFVVYSSNFALLKFFV